jgi:phage terminase large subunit GpA-like protein
MTDPTVHTVVCMKPGQAAWSTAVENGIAYHVDVDPCPILMVQPRDKDCQKFTRKRFNPMVRDTPCLAGKIPSAKSRDPGNTILEKIFPGGSLTLVGANSPAGLSGDSVRIVALEEVDRYPQSAGTEGDPVDLAKQRAEGFFHIRKIWMGSTPRDKETSRIEPAYLESDQRKLFCPCPDCGHHQVLVWIQVRWQKELRDGALVWNVPDDYVGPVIDLPETALYFCNSCGSGWGDAKRLAAARWGEWRATRPFRGIAGFHFNRLISDHKTLAAMAEDFIASRDFPERLKVFVNTTLAETWVVKGATVESTPLMARRENYGPTLVPKEVVVLVAGVDVQDDRLEYELFGIGRGEEDWSLRVVINRADPSTQKPWDELDQWLRTVHQREDGIKLQVAAACIDTAGHHTQAAYAFCRNRYARRVWAIRGVAGPRPIWPRKASKKNIGKVDLFFVGVDTAKEQIYSRLNLEKPGPGYSHFPNDEDHDEEYFKQLAAEKIITTYHRGFAKRRWEKIRDRNEALDRKAYAIAALHGLVAGGFDLEREAVRLEAEAAAVKAGAIIAPPQRRVRSRGIA